METRIHFCVVLDAIAVFSLIVAGGSLAGSALLPFDAIELFRWSFSGAIALFGIARICEIARILWHTPNAQSMRQPAGAATPALGSAGSESRFPRAA